jgi:hypothetical protein
VELKLWRAILAVATGEKIAASAIGEFLESNVPWKDLQDVSDADRNFFLSGMDFPLNLVSVLKVSSSSPLKMRDR